jgi:ribonucleoside-triphosphate reductase (thioredoxin)
VFKNDAAEFVYYRTYSKWNNNKQRRETWPETVDRVINFFKEERGELVPPKVFKKLKEYMLDFSVLPSMRLVWSAGEAARKSNVCMYNCSFIPVDSIEAFSECLYILCCGTGVGFSVEKYYVDKLPVVQKLDISHVAKTCIVGDSKEAWADSVKFLMKSLYEGKDLKFDYGSIRPKGSILKTMGGRASGSEPLILLHGFIKHTFSKAQGRKLTTLECHDIMNKIAEIVVVGGVRRSSQISLSDLSDEDMRDAKIWPFPQHRSMANNSAVYLEKPSAVEFLKEWGSLAASGTGERGIFNFDAVKKLNPERTANGVQLRVNPCGEILLREKQFCNLSTVIIKPDDDLDSLLEKVECATWVGTLQSSFTKFPYLRKKWKQNCEEEALLGVSLSGQLDNPDILTAEALRALKNRAIKVNKKAAKLLSISESASLTCGKPEGTTSQLVSSGSGAHPWYAPYFIRRYRISGNDPLYKMMKDQGFKFSPENGQTQENVTTFVVSFPVKAPDTAVFRNAMSAIDQLEWYKKIQTNWCTHNQSITVYVKDSEWFDVGNWVYKNWDICVGISFLPYDGGHYVQAPYEEITKEQYEKLIKDFPKIDYSKLSNYEQEDNTEGAKTLACVGDKCEIT